MRLVLFDIDGTLLHCGRQVGAIFCGALRDVFGGHGPLEGFSFAGKTDPMIVLELLRDLGLEQSAIRERLPEVRDLYLERLEQGLRRERMTLLPGVVEILEPLRRCPERAIGLLTGNWRGGAEIKLGRFGLNEYFELGAFGEDAADRRGLVPVAIERATAQYGVTFDPADVLIVGDTELDVDCARHAGVRCVAVATGFTTADRLHAAGADWVFADLREAMAALPELSA
jgi:phosphoglycolate phosphatase